MKSINISYIIGNETGNGLRLTYENTNLSHNARIYLTGACEFINYLDIQNEISNRTQNFKSSLLYVKLTRKFSATCIHGKLLSSYTQKSRVPTLMYICNITCTQSRFLELLLLHGTIQVIFPMTNMPKNHFGYSGTFIFMHGPILGIVTMTNSDTHKF